MYLTESRIKQTDRLEHMQKMPLDQTEKSHSLMVKVGGVALGILAFVGIAITLSFSPIITLGSLLGIGTITLIAQYILSNGNTKNQGEEQSLPSSSPFPASFSPSEPSSSSSNYTPTLFLSSESSNLSQASFQGSCYTQMAKIPQEILVDDGLGQFNEGTLRLLPGSHSIKLEHGGYKKYRKGDVLQLNIEGPIYGFRNPSFSCMPGVSECLMMNKNDFNNIEEVIHSGAFGGCHKEFDGERMLVWKIPADLLAISGYEASSNPVPVGDYQLFDDYCMEYLDSIHQNLIRSSGEKMRMDFKKSGDYDVRSIHYLVNDSNKEMIPAISTGNFYVDFNNPTNEESELVKQMLINLKGLGVKAYSCNGAHHLVIFYAYVEDKTLKPMNPKILASFLQNEAIFNVIQNAAIKDIKPWRKYYIQQFLKEG